jgi:hypothetical protein
MSDDIRPARLDLLHVHVEAGLLATAGERLGDRLLMAGSGWNPNQLLQDRLR